MTHRERDLRKSVRGIRELNGRRATTAANEFNRDRRVEYHWSQKFQWAIDRFGDSIHVNPRMVRDIVIRTVESEISVWNNVDGPTSFTVKSVS